MKVLSISVNKEDYNFVYEFDKESGTLKTWYTWHYTIWLCVFPEKRNQFLLSEVDLKALQNDYKRTINFFLLFSAKYVYHPVFTVSQVLQIQSYENTCTNDFRKCDLLNMPSRHLEWTLNNVLRFAFCIFKYTNLIGLLIKHLFIIRLYWEKERIYPNKAVNFATWIYTCANTTLKL